MKIDEILNSSIMIADDYDEITLFRLSCRAENLALENKIPFKIAVEKLIIEECKYFSFSSLKEQIKLRDSILHYIKEN